MSFYESVVDEVTRCLAEDSHNESRIIERLHHIQREKGDELYQALLYVLTHLEFSKKTAKKHWEGIMAHRREMSEILGREIGLRVAMCDYFFNVNKTLKNPIIIEIDVFEEARRFSNTDGLTGLFNRRYFQTALERELSRAKRFNNDLSLIFIDIDDFKQYNDTYGHLAGDEVLKTVAQTLLQSKRMIDIACRYGGEEFVLILPRSPKSGALNVGERIRRNIEEIKPNPKSSRHLKKAITISGGISTFPQDALDVQNLIMGADNALYSAKRSGKNRIDLFSIEKRRFIRVRVDKPIYYRIVDVKDEPLHEGRALDISEGGLLCEVDRVIPAASTMWIEMRLPRSQKVHSFLGGVVRSNGGKHQQHHAGVTFLRMQQYSRQALSQYVGQALHQHGESEQ